MSRSWRVDPDETALRSWLGVPSTDGPDRLWGFFLLVTQRGSDGRGVDLAVGALQKDSLQAARHVLEAERGDVVIGQDPVGEGEAPAWRCAGVRKVGRL